MMKIVGILMASVVVAQAWPVSKHELQRQRNGDFICRVAVERSWRVNAFGQTEPEKKAACIPVTEQGEDEEFYQLNLPDWFMAEHQEKIHQGTLYVKISGGRIANDSILIPTESDVVVVDQTRVPQQQRQRHLQQNVGTRKLLVARISLNDTQVSFATSDLEEYIFGLSTSSISVANQFIGCSSARLVIEPSTLGGVVDIMVNKSISEYSSWRLLRNDAAVALKNFVGTSQLTAVADYVMLCLPPGNWNFMASTTSGYWRSAYDDAYCGYLSVVMHELGYSMSLTDSNDVKPLQDTTCYMGQYSATVASPQKCFNAQKHWQLGWFSDKALTVSPTISPQSFSLATFLDYNDTISSDVVVLNIGNLYLQYNSATGFNVGTGENKNQVVVVQTQSNGDSEKLAGLNLQNPTLTIPNFQNDLDLLIEVCQFNSSRLDIAIVSIALGNCSCSCSTPSPTSLGTTHAPSSGATTLAPSKLVTTLAPSTLVPSSVTTTLAPSGLATTLAPSSLGTSFNSSSAPTKAPSGSALVPTSPLITVAPSAALALNQTNSSTTTSPAPAASPTTTTTVPGNVSSMAPSAPVMSPSNSSGIPSHPTIFSHPSASPLFNKSMPSMKPSVFPIGVNSTLSPKVKTLYPTSAHGALDPIQTSAASRKIGSIVGIVLMGLGMLL